jgi:extradiol dioxygenase family protein
MEMNDDCNTPSPFPSCLPRQRPRGRTHLLWRSSRLLGGPKLSHLAPQETGEVAANAVDGHGVPVRHFGVVLSMEEWEAAAERLTKANIEFVIKPYIRFLGEPGEQATMFFKDPSGNAVELKAFADINSLFAK